MHIVLEQSEQLIWKYREKIKMEQTEFEMFEAPVVDWWRFDVAADESDPAPDIDAEVRVLRDLRPFFEGAEDLVRVIV